MFDFQWSEIALIGVVALVLIGPKDLPVAIRAITDAIKKMRRMAGELQTHVDDMVRDADLQEARDTFRDIRGMNVRSQVMRAIDDDGSLRKTLTEKPLQGENLLARTPSAGTSYRSVPPAVPTDAAPAFVPPQSVRSPVHVAAGPVSPPPAFIPPPAARLSELSHDAPTADTTTADTAA